MSALSIQIVSDVVCPWCYIGKQQIDQALARWAEIHPDAPTPELSWHPFQLNPGMPEEGVDRASYLQAKFGSPDGGPGYKRLVEVMQKAGLEFRPELIQVQPSTLRAHALIGAAAQFQRQHEVSGALFEAYFTRGVGIGDAEQLQALAAEHGWPDEMVEIAQSPEALEAAAAADEQARDAGVRGVPFFIFNGRLAVSGAQGVDALLSAMEQSQADAPTSA